MPDKPKWSAIITKLMHDDPVVVAGLWPEIDMLGSSEYRLAKIGNHYLLGKFDSAFDSDYEWIDSPEKVKIEMSGLVEIIGENDDEWSAWQDPKLVDSIVDSAPLFGEEWTPDEIVKEIKADENFGLRILSPDAELPEEYHGA